MPGSANTSSTPPISAASPGVHDQHPVGDAGHDAKVMADEDHRRARSRCRTDVSSVEDLRLHRHVQRRRRLVGDEQLRLVGDGDGDHDPLPHAAGQLVREAPGHPGRARAGRRRPAARPRGAMAARPADLAVQQDALGDLPADGVHRVECGHRVLEDHRDPASRGCSATARATCRAARCRPAGSSRVTRAGAAAGP